MIKRVVAILVLVVAAILLTFWYLHGLGLPAYLMLEAGVAVGILYLIFSVLRIADPGNDRMRRSRRKFY